jgi:hypothetical protein
LADFKCYYCGLEKTDTERSDEHIIPSCIGGNRNVTLTDHVCGGDVGCNAFMGQHVDHPFCRDWFIEATRLSLGIKHRRKRPIAFMGTINWTRPERAALYTLEGGVTIIQIRGRDGEERLVALLDASDDELVAILKNALREKFSGLRVINIVPEGMTPDPYDDGIVSDLIALGASLPVQNQISTTAWHRELVKIALGLACQVFGDPFVTSKDADRLRQFLREHDVTKRSAMKIPGHVGISDDRRPRLTANWHPGGDEHLFGLIVDGNAIVLVANLFGRFENLVQVTTETAFVDALGGMSATGIGWIVDPDAKTTIGPNPL